jgi:hypothetical protein
MERMTPVERLKYHRERNQRYYGDRPDRVERHKELTRAAAERRRAIMTEDDRLKRNAAMRQWTKEKRANMTVEEKEMLRLKRREKHLKKMADPVFAEKWRSEARERMKKYRDRKKTLDAGGKAG